MTQTLFYKKRLDNSPTKLTVLYPFRIVFFELGISVAPSVWLAPSSGPRLARAPAALIPGVALLSGVALLPRDSSR
jgi:hypothetical protein